METMNVSQACEYIGVTKAYLARARRGALYPGEPKGPKVHIVRGRSVYLKTELDSWIELMRTERFHESMSQKLGIKKSKIPEVSSQLEEGKWIRTRDAAIRISVDEGYLQRARTGHLSKWEPPGPPSLKLGNAVFYDVQELDNWMKKQESLSGSQSYSSEDRFCINCDTIDQHCAGEVDIIFRIKAGSELDLVQWLMSVHEDRQKLLLEISAPFLPWRAISAEIGSVEDRNDGTIFRITPASILALNSEGERSNSIDIPIEFEGIG